MVTGWVLAGIYLLIATTIQVWALRHLATRLTLAVATASENGVRSIDWEQQRATIATERGRYITATVIGLVAVTLLAVRTPILDWSLYALIPVATTAIAATAAATWPKIKRDGIHALIWWPITLGLALVAGFFAGAPSQAQPASPTDLTRQVMADPQHASTIIKSNFTHQAISPLTIFAHGWWAIALVIALSWWARHTINTARRKAAYKAARSTKQAAALHAMERRPNRIVSGRRRPGALK